VINIRAVHCALSGRGDLRKSYFPRGPVSRLVSLLCLFVHAKSRCSRPDIFPSSRKSKCSARVPALGHENVAVTLQVSLGGRMKKRKRKKRASIGTLLCSTTVLFELDVIPCYRFDAESHSVGR